jgi:hypothetical protein
MDFSKKHFDCEGPLGFPLKDGQAKALDRILKTLPRDDAHKYRKAVLVKAPTELLAGERADVSWISTEALDRVNEVVVARGMNDGQFQKNPVVTLNHNYWRPPVAKSLWRKWAQDGDTVGVKAKTQYPAAPASWPDGQVWEPDTVFSLVQASLLNAKSIGFLPLKLHYPDEAECARKGYPSDALVFDEWLLMEYAVCPFGANQEALVSEVSKAGALDEKFWEALGLARPPLSLAEPPAAVAVPLEVLALGPPPLSAAERLAFVSLPEIQKAVQSELASMNLGALIRKSVDDALKARKGAV